MRVGDADALGEEVDHGGRASRSCGGHPPLARAARSSRRRRRCAARGRPTSDERSGHQRHQVGRVREVEDVVPAHAPVWLLGALAQDAVREHEVSRGRGADDLGGELLDRLVEAGPVAARIVVLPLGPALRRPVGVVGVRADEVEPACGLAGITDGDHQLGALGLGRRAGYAQPLAVVVERGRPTVDRDRGDVELHRVEGHRRRAPRAGRSPSDGLSRRGGAARGRGPIPGGRGRSRRRAIGGVKLVRVPGGAKDRGIGARSYASCSGNPQRVPADGAGVRRAPMVAHEQPRAGARDAISGARRPPRRSTPW